MIRSLLLQILPDLVVLAYWTRWLRIIGELCWLITFGGFWLLSQGFTSIHPFCKYFSEDKTCHSQERQERRAVYKSKSQISIRNCQKRKREPWHTVCFEFVLMVESHGSIIRHDRRMSWWALRWTRSFAGSAFHLHEGLDSAVWKHLGSSVTVSHRFHRWRWISPFDAT